VTNEIGRDRAVNDPMISETLRFIISRITIWLSLTTVSG